MGNWFLCNFPFPPTPVMGGVSHTLDIFLPYVYELKTAYFLFDSQLKNTQTTLVSKTPPRGPPQVHEELTITFVPPMTPPILDFPIKNFRGVWLLFSSVLRRGLKARVGGAHFDLFPLLFFSPFLNMPPRR